MGASSPLMLNYLSGGAPNFEGKKNLSQHNRPEILIWDLQIMEQVKDIANCLRNRYQNVTNMHKELQFEIAMMIIQGDIFACMHTDGKAGLPILRIGAKFALRLRCLEQWFSAFFCSWPISEFHSVLWPPTLRLFNYNKCNIYNKYVLYQLHFYL
jgi:hypothetical protein